MLKRLSFFPLYILASFVEDKVSIGSWIYLWAFYSVPLIYISVFVLVFKKHMGVHGSKGHLICNLEKNKGNLIKWKHSGNLDEGYKGSLCTSITNFLCLEK